MRHSGRFEFSCPECRETFRVTASGRDALVGAGCAVCGAPVHSDAFDRGPA